MTEQLTLNADITVEELFQTWAAFPKEGQGPNWENPNENQMISMGHFEPRPDNYRKTFDIKDLSALAGSFEANGQLQTIQLLRHEPRARVWGGHRRALAAVYRYCVAVREGQNPRIPMMRCELVVKTMSPVDEAVGAILLNEQEEPSPLEEADEFQRIMSEYNISEETLAFKLGGERGAEQKLQHIQRRLMLLNLVSQAQGYPLRENVARGTINLTDAELYAQLPQADQPTVARMRLSGAALVAQVRTMLSRPTRVTSGVRETTFPASALPSAGVPVRPTTTLGDINRRHNVSGETDQQPVRPFAAPPAPARDVRTFNLGSGPAAIAVELEITRFSAQLTLKRSGGEPFNEGMVAGALAALGQYIKSRPASQGQTAPPSPSSNGAPAPETSAALH